MKQTRRQRQRMKGRELGREKKPFWYVQPDTEPDLPFMASLERSIQYLQEANDTAAGHGALGGGV